MLDRNQNTYPLRAETKDGTFIVLEAPHFRHEQGDDYVLWAGRNGTTYAALGAIYDVHGDWCPRLRLLAGEPCPVGVDATILSMLATLRNGQDDWNFERTRSEVA